jgi:hypothetical protein
MPAATPPTRPGLTHRATLRPALALAQAPLPDLKAPRLLDRVRERIRSLHYNLRTE